MDDYVKRLNSKGFDVVVAALDGNQHKTTTMPASPMEKARKFINDFCMMEHGEEADFSDLHRIALAHSTTGDGQHFIDVSADLVDFRMVYQVNGEAVASFQYYDLDYLNEHFASLNFDELIAYAEDQYRQQLQKEPDTVGADSDRQ